MDQQLPKKLGFGFLPIPEELMQSKAISWGAKHLWGIIAKANLEEVKWGIEYLSERMKCGERETKNRIAELKSNNLILVKKTGRSNIYSINLELVQLIQDEKGNNHSPMIGECSVPIRGEQTAQPTICSKEVSKRLPDAPAEWSLLKETDKLLVDPKRHIQIIGIWVREMKLRPENKEQMQSLIRRNLRAAQLLTGYKNEDLVETLKTLKNTPYLTKFTLETVGKYIDEVVANKKKQGPKIIRWEEVRRPNEAPAMRPIYEKIS